MTNLLNQLREYGLQDMAYIKLVTVDGKEFHSIHAADGTPLTIVDTRELAFATVTQHEMKPHSVH